MISKATELAGFGLVAAAFAMWLGVPAGLMAGGFALLLIGSTTDDAKAAGALRDAFAWAARRSPIRLPQQKTVPCFCGGDAQCPVCHGEGRVPNPNLRVGPGPHPPIQIDDYAQAVARTMAQNRLRRGDGRMREPTP